MERRADPPTQLEVDQAILDYLLYSAIQALIRNYREIKYKNGHNHKHGLSVGTMLQMVDCMLSSLPCIFRSTAYLVTAFLTLFRTIHSRDQVGEEIRFRLRLLKYTALFSSYFASVPIQLSSKRVKKLRSHTFRGKEIAREITGYAVDLTDNGCADRSSGTHVLDDLENGALKIPYQKSSPLSMLDTLPSFMALSAAQSALQALPVSDVWMRLAAGYMAHAALEQNLLHGVHLTDALNEAFAWRFDPESSAEEGSDEWAINTMFFGEDGEVDGWSDIRDEHICAVSRGPELPCLKICLFSHTTQIIPPNGVSIHVHINSLLANELAFNTFQESLMSFIEGLLGAQSRPIYTQIEMGEVTGLSRSDIGNLLALLRANG